MNTKEVKPGAPRRRRRHDAEFKARVIEACLKPGVSVAAIALANGLNANFVRVWVKAYREGTALTTVTASPADAGLPATLVPISVTAPTVAESPDIRIEIRRSQTTVQLAWPVSQASALGHWLKDLLK